MSIQTSGMAARLRQIRESEATVLVPQPRRSALAAALELASAPERVVVPMPRRGRMYVRHGEGGGEFSAVTLTSPLRGSEAPSA